ncbi:hypothetical protein PENSUB_9347 [Penicillium subrubescens]|uniref:MOSC domain-containing protein n=2 Tax=Penicillium subrubescens TaxID=1316194 RepID=A0A1Q5TDF3_9EURO|nr:hypothetical protein PENSUB_9347 [Penicillium subrubescens]
MADQYDPKFSQSLGTTVNGSPRIKAIYLHPVKSCGPVEVDRALLTKTGFMYDRCFALATKTVTGDDAAASKWRFISQRTKPLMSQIKAELWLPHKDSDAHDPLVQSGGCVVLTFEDPDLPSRIDRVETFFYTWDYSAKPQVSFIVPLNVTVTQVEEFQVKMTTFIIHDRDAKGLDMGRIPSIATALPKLKRYLGINEGQILTLFKCTPDTLTLTNENLAPLEYIGSPALHGYTDSQPININSLSSVQAVSAHLPTENQPMNALRFRANIWISNAPAYEEETWKRFCILPKSGGTQPRASIAPTISVVCRTSRCTMPNVDPESGKFDTDNPLPGKKRGKPQPSTTLMKYRTVETGNNGALGYLGMHCVPEDRNFKEVEENEVGVYVKVGDEIEVLERGVHLYGSTGNDY